MTVPNFLNFRALSSSKQLRCQVVTCTSKSFKVSLINLNSLLNLSVYSPFLYSAKQMPEQMSAQPKWFEIPHNGRKENPSSQSAQSNGSSKAYHQVYFTVNWNYFHVN